MLYFDRRLALCVRPLGSELDRGGYSPPPANGGWLETLAPRGLRQGWGKSAISHGPGWLRVVLILYVFMRALDCCLYCSFASSQGANSFPPRAARSAGDPALRGLKSKLRKKSYLYHKKCSMQHRKAVWGEGLASTTLDVGKG